MNESLGCPHLSFALLFWQYFPSFLNLFPLLMSIKILWADCESLSEYIPDWELTTLQCLRQGWWVVSKTVDIRKGRSCNSLRSTERTLAFYNWEIIVIFAESNFRWVFGLKPPLGWIFWPVRRLSPFGFSEWVWFLQVGQTELGRLVWLEDGPG